MAHEKPHTPSLYAACYGQDDGTEVIDHSRRMTLDMRARGGLAALMGPVAGGLPAPPWLRG